MRYINIKEKRLFALSFPFLRKGANYGWGGEYIFDEKEEEYIFLQKNIL